MTDIEWADPPLRTHGGSGLSSKWTATQDALRARPGEWALVWPSASQGTPTTWRKGMSGWTPGEFEIRSVHTKVSGKVDIYVRYIGGAS